MKINKIHLGKIFVDFLEVLLVSTGVFLISYILIGQLVEVNGPSMLPNLKDKEQLIAEKVSYKLSEPKRGDIVVIKHPTNQSKMLIKRIIGLPGEKIRIDDGKVYINDNILDESDYLTIDHKTDPKTIFENGIDYQIEDNGYIVFGDNREISSDSREFGAIPRELILAKAMLIYYPFSDFRLLLSNIKYNNN